jgi:integrase
MGKMGRPQKPYQTSWGEVVPGLTKDTNGRWRIVTTGERFRELDERLAVLRFRRSLPNGTLFIPVARSEDISDNADAGDALNDQIEELHHIEHDDGSDEIGHVIDAAAGWNWFRQQLIERPEYVAKQTGIPQIASLHLMGVPKPSITLKELLRVYKATSDATEKSKKEASAPFKRLIAFTGATTLNDLTTERLAAFREHVMTKCGLRSSGTIAAYFSRIRYIVRFAFKHGLDSQQLSAALDRMKVLYPPPCNTRPDPKPISRADFNTLLCAADGTWRAILLISLNACLYMEEVCRLRWEELNLDAKTFVSHRLKRGHVVRVAVLWDETVEALRALPRRGQSPYVFTSPHGTRYNKNTKINDFKDFRERFGVPNVTFSHIRDGAYTVACQFAEEKFSRILAGHKFAGLTDNYVKRNPSFVKPACDAVYRHYFG